LQYTLLGDPALVLSYPSSAAVVDDINGTSVRSGRTIQIKAGSKVTVNGHISKNSSLDTSFNGILTSTVRDCVDTVVCKNNVGGSGALFTYQDRPNTLYTGNDSVKNGTFSFVFAVAKDISYNNGSGMINLYAVNNDLSEEAGGFYSDDFTLGGSDIAKMILWDLRSMLSHSSSFVNNGNVNTTPYFVAQVADNDGHQCFRNGIGHDLELIIDGDMSQTYV
jgi:hypothetical protein